ncbi:MAG: hypothetical protein ACI361_05155 [Atopobiaceae bacterium]
MADEEEKHDYMPVGDADEEEIAAAAEIIKGKYSIRPLLIAIVAGIILIWIISIKQSLELGELSEAPVGILFFSVVWTVWISILFAAIVMGRRNWKKHPVAVIAAALLFLYLMRPLFNDLALLIWYGEINYIPSVKVILAPMAAEIFLRIFLFIADGKDWAKDKIQKGKAQDRDVRSHGSK